MDSWFVLIRVHLLNIAVKSVHGQSRVSAVHYVRLFPTQASQGPASAKHSFQHQLQNSRCEAVPALGTTRQQSHVNLADPCINWNNSIRQSMARPVPNAWYCFVLWKIFIPERSRRVSKKKYGIFLTTSRRQVHVWRKTLGRTSKRRPVAPWFLLMKAIEMFWGPRNHITTRTPKTRSASPLKHIKNRKEDVDRESKI